MGRAPVWMFCALVGCAGAEATTLPTTTKGAATTATNEVGINPGETMAFEVRIRGVLAGEAALAVGEVGDIEGKRAVVIKSRAATSGLAAAILPKITDEATTTLDLATGRPMSLHTIVEHGTKRTEANAVFTGTVADVTYKRSDEEKPHTFKINFGQNAVHDTHSAMAQVRGWRPAPGATRTIFVVGGRRLWRIDVRPAGIETVGSALGNRRAIKLEGQSFRAKPNFEIEANRPARTFTVWLSDDADRVPLKLLAHTELGDVTVDLTDYQRP